MQEFFSSFCCSVLESLRDGKHKTVDTVILQTMWVYETLVNRYTDHSYPLNLSVVVVTCIYWGGEVDEINIYAKCSKWFSCEVTRVVIVKSKHSALEVFRRIQSCHTGTLFN